MSTNTDPCIKRLIEDLKTIRPHVLVAEDDQNDADLMQRVLTSIGCEVFIAPSAAKSLEILGWDTTGEISLIFLDLKFNGGMTGLDVLNWLRTNRPRIPVVIVSGYVDQRLLDIGGYIAVIQKPFTQADIREILQKHKLL